jgi:predicted alpha/beta hydrolase
VQPPGLAGSTTNPTDPTWQPVQSSPREPLVKRQQVEWTIADPAFAPLTDASGAATTRVLFGVDHGAAYRIEVPLQGWNGDVVFWEHGYRGTGTTLTVDNPGYGLREHYIANGYAWAASSYSANRYDIEAGVESTERLAKLFDRLVAPADQRYLQGVSMGGHVIGVLLERQRGVEWAGAAPMCGVMGDRELFDFFLSYNLAAQALAGVDAYPIPADYLTNAVPRIKVALGLPTAGTPLGTPLTDPEGLALRELTTELTGGPRPGDDAAFDFWERQSFLFGVLGNQPGGTVGVAPGNVATNATDDYPEVYTFADGDSLDQRIERVAPAQQARRSGPSAYVPDITATFDVPVLSIHTLGDYYVPFSMEQVYAAEAEQQGTRDLLVQRAVRAAGHCEFTPQEAITQFDDLVRWVEDGVKPDGDDVLDRAEVASPDFGCDWTTPATTGTRRLYPAC